jgi:hypothetical protein
MSGLSTMCLIGVLAHWAGVAIIIVRRPAEPRVDDLAFVRFGHWIAWPLTISMAQWFPRF